MAVQFGKSGCSSITVEPFTPICSFEAPAGTTPLTFDVPAVSIAMPVPPAECQCFDFTSESTTTNVGVAGCGESGKASFDVEVVKADDDCCTGRYKVRTKGSVSVPCMPFTVSDPLVNVHSKSGSTAEADMDGKVGEFYVRKGTGTSCCSLESGIDITFPDCKKGYDSNAVPLAQITYCDGNNTKSHQFITLKQDTDNCTLYPEVHPFTLPCCTLEDKTSKFTFSVNGTQYTGSLARNDCDYSITMPSINIPIPTPAIPDVCQPDLEVDTKVAISYKYKDEDGDEKTHNGNIDTENEGIWLTKEVHEGDSCYTYKLNVGTLDLTDIPTMSITSGGDVYAVTTSGDSGKTTKLYIDGDKGGGEYWYLGGIGTKAKSDPTAWNGLGTSQGAALDVFGTDFTGDDGQVPVSQHAHTIAKADNMTAKSWRSSRRSDNDTDVKSGSDDLSSDSAYVTGDLDTILLTGAEWNYRGIELRASHFVYSNCGVLSFVDENSDTGSSIGPVVAPGVSTVTYGGVSKNASGLVVYPTKQDSTTFAAAQMAADVTALTSGLSVHPGKGVRIHGVTGMKPDSTKYGYKATDANDTLTEGDLGKLEVNVRDDDLAFTSDGRLGFNDAEPTGSDNHTLGVANDGTTLRVKSFSRGRGKDYTIPIMVMPAYDVNVTGTNETIWNDAQIDGTSPCGNKTKQVFHRFKTFGATDGYGNEWYLDDYRHLMGIMYLHVSASGIILGIDYTPDCSGCCRPTTTK